ncbi:hypothetical protein DZC30_06080 [Comamonas testosteroni]|uniref:EpsG family protein n=1 Tax=Comamonas testosteroni TaxID=285 RepID=A0A373FQ87_COMTE|nr:EpsG family protein [Comamonas testosteroni]RGE46047.1 hypothetical protein DZC30_06080 [Comamonas testosteroni]
MLLSRLGYLLFSVFLVLLLSFRTIPAVDDSNDLGRYLEYWSEFCRGGGYEGVSYFIFMNFYGVSCWVDSQWFFIFLTALTIPLGICCYVKNSIGMLIGISALISVASLELMTNALRQGLAFLFFAYAVFMLGQRVRSYFLFVASIASHSSLFFYSPILFIFNKINNILTRVFLLIFGGILIYIFSEKIGIYLNEYMEIYAEKPKNSYIAFLLMGYLLPVISLIFNVDDFKRYVQNRVFLYNSLLVIASYFIFPYIFYRFAIFSTLINYLLIFDKFDIVRKFEWKSVGLLMILTVAHTLTMIHFSKSFLYGVFS